MTIRLIDLKKYCFGIHVDSESKPNRQIDCDSLARRILDRIDIKLSGKILNRKRHVFPFRLLEYSKFKNYVNFFEIISKE